MSWAVSEDGAISGNAVLRVGTVDLYLLCICVLLNDAVCSSVCVASNALNRE